tara:strand:+ start:12309 stop:13172 length:864 start_codon:yes stop_codon:yes gene_type:complete
MAVECPRCGAEEEDLIKIEAGLKLRIQEVLPDEDVPAEVCGKCFNELRENVSHGAKLRAEINIKEHNKKVLWKNRVSLVKAARERMSVKAYAEASVLYEKYIRTLELVHDVPPGKLNPKEIKAKGQEKELTLFASVLWDLIRIYDTRENYGPRLTTTANKLVEVIPHTPAGKDLLKRAEKHMKVAHHTKEMREFLKQARKAAKSNCFLVSAVFYLDDSPELRFYRQFRDEILLRSWWGRIFVRCYYIFAPSLANVLDFFPQYKAPLRQFFRSFALRLAKTFHLKSPL